MNPDWRSIVRDRIPPLELEHEPEILNELAQHLSDLYTEALAQGRSTEEALEAAVAALPAERDRLARDIVSARRSLPALIADRWTGDASVSPEGTKPRWFADFRRDLRLALRLLWRSPGYTIVALLTLALGIGANTAIFAAVDTVLLRPMPYAGADRLVVPMSVKKGQEPGDSVSYGDYADWSRETAVFEAVSLWRTITIDLTGAGRPDRINAIQVSPEYFRVITLTPAAGRLLIPSDHDAKAARVTVISHGLWMRLFGGADVLGRTVGIGGTPFQIVGVLPARVAWPEQGELFIPLRPALLDEETRTRRDNLIFQSVARLRPGVQIEQGNAVLAVIAGRVARDFPGSRGAYTNELRPLREAMVSPDLRRALWILLAAVGAVLLIGCANLAHLGLVRGLGRQRELSVRLALGAGRWRLVRQLGVESLLLATAGGSAGVALAYWMVRGLKTIAPADTPFINDLAIDPRVLAATMAATLLAVVLSGLLPALASARVPLGSALKDGSAGAGTSRRVQMLRRALVVGEVAGAVVLLIAASLLLRSFWRVQHIDPGFDAGRVLAGRISLPRRYATTAQSEAFFRTVVDRLSHAPGVEAAGLTSFVPVGGGGFGLGRVYLLEGWAEPPAGPEVSAQWNVVSPDYFRTMGIPVLRGRAFTSADQSITTPVAIVSRSFAESMFGSTDPLGKRVRSWRDENIYREIIGIVDEVRYTGLVEREASRQFYVPHSQNSWGLMNIVVRSTGAPPAGLESTLRKEVSAIDPELAVSNVSALDAIARDSVANERYTTLLVSLLASTALALGAIGIYGVINHAVSMRRRELGLRAALGASPRHLYGLVLWQALWLTTLGLGIGLAGAMAAAGALESILYDTPTRDPLAYAATAVTIMVVTGLACLGPVRRAAKSDPLTVLR
ncbi:MAG TPA: ABC transporter permease [Vicinamibacterales bacterium]|nr:ABC transporter permease [Vicinamibacterales bacterium]